MAIILARSAVAQKTQLALETTYGVDPLGIYKRLPTLQVKPKPDVETKVHREQGQKFASVVIPNKEWSSGTFDGALTYGELPFIYSSLYALPAGYPFTPDGSGAVQWVMSPSNDTPDVPATFQAQHGDTGTQGIQWGGLVVLDATLEITRAEAKLSGTILGKRWSTGHTLDGSAETIENVPITPGSLTASLDPTYEGIGATKLTGLLSWHQQMAARWGMEWILDATQSDFAKLVEMAPTPTLTLLLEADEQAMDLFATYRLGSTVYLRLTTGTGGPVLGAGHYAFQMDVPAAIKTLQEYKDEGGVYAIGYEFEPLADTNSAGFSHRMSVINRVATL